MDAEHSLESMSILIAICCRTALSLRRMSVYGTPLSRVKKTNAKASITAWSASKSDAQSMLVSSSGASWSSRGSFKRDRNTAIYSLDYSELRSSVKQKVLSRRTGFLAETMIFWRTCP